MQYLFPALTKSTWFRGALISSGTVLLLAFFRVDARFSAALLALTSILYGAGLWSCLSPLWGRLWQSALGKGALSAFHGSIYLFCLIPARSLVAEALGLPTKDFDLTVNIIAIFTYPLALLVAISLIIGVASVVLLCIGLPYWVLNQLQSSVRDFIPERYLPTFAAFEKTTRERWTMFFGHAGGLLVILFIAAIVSGFYGRKLDQAVPLVRDLAYCADYQNAAKYPGVKHSSRMRLHDNGVVSYASLVNGHVEITTENVK